MIGHLRRKGNLDAGIRPNLVTTCHASGRPSFNRDFLRQVLLDGSRLIALTNLRPVLKNLTPNVDGINRFVYFNGGGNGRFCTRHFHCRLKVILFGQFLNNAGNLANYFLA